MFASFALFAVYVSKTECPLEFSPRNTRKPRTKKGASPGRPNRETRENREQKNGVSPVVLKRFKVESKKRFTLPQEREPKAVKEEEVLVRTLRVVRGSGNSKGVSLVGF